MRLLIVDDARDTLLLISTILESLGYEVVQSNNGLEAWEIIQNESIQLVISDWLMPGIDGPELCRRIRATDFGHYVYFILLTSLEDKASLIKGLDAGADDFMVKPPDRDELQVRIRAGERILELERQLEERNSKLSKAYQTIEKDMRSAAAMQKALLPQPKTLQEVNLDWLFLPSHFVAGDMFDYFLLDQDHLAFYQLDVAGHGASAALLSFTLNKVMSEVNVENSLLKRYIEQPPYYRIVPPELVIRALNRRFDAENNAMLYFTMIYGVVDLNSRRLTFTQAGHPSPLLIRRADSQVETVGSGGFPVGMLPNASYDIDSVELQPGDRLYIYSDGITECENSKGEPFSVERLSDFLVNTADRPLATVTRILGHTLRNWKGDEQYQDDITLLALEWGTSPTH
jgi:sigma-B regulation protein RsbU (phosphoserine phosphatase)